MAGTLYIVGTPIGNLKDITYRAVETLKSVDIIACEDTRHSRTLLDAYGISAPLVSYYKQKEREGSEQLVKKLLDGKNIALITDAGMPAISDPGAILVSEARNSGVTVTVVPGPTAVASAMALSGYLDGGFTFLGFLPEKRKDKSGCFVRTEKQSACFGVLRFAARSIFAGRIFVFGAWRQKGLGG